MKDAFFVVHPKKSSLRGNIGRKRVDLLGAAVLGFPGKEAAWFALSRVPAHYRWQAHGDGRRFHQAPHSMHICRAPRAG